MRWDAIGAALLALSATGCAEMARATNNGGRSAAEAEARSQQEDAAAWQGIPLITLETHPTFSTLPRQADTLSDGSQLWTYQRCTNYEVPARCAAYPIGTVAFTRCTGGRVEQTCCLRQFRIVEGTVQSFRALGPCLTGCKFRPSACGAG